MDRALSHEAIIDLLGAYALDAVDPNEATEIEEHLATCPRCRDEVLQYQQTAAMLADPAGQAPAGLWDGIASRIARPATTETAAPSLVPLPAAGAGQRSPQRRRFSTPARVATALAVAAAAAIAVLGVDIGRLDNRLNRVEAAGSAPGISQAARAALLDPAAQRTLLKGAGKPAAPVAEVVTQSSGAAFLFNGGLHSLPADRTYQLWAISGGRAVSLGLLGPNPTTVAFGVGSAKPPAAYAVTVEPRAGSVTPSGAPVASSA